MTEDEGFAAIPRAMLRDPDVPQEAKLVYLAISSHVGRDGTAWPSTRTIAGYLRMGRSTIFKQLEWLRENGYLSWEEQQTAGKAGSGSRAHRYYLGGGLRSETTPPVEGGPHTETTPPAGGGPAEDHPGPAEDQGGLTARPEESHLTRDKKKRATKKSATKPGPPSEPGPVASPEAGRAKRRRAAQTMMTLEWRPSDRERARSMERYSREDLAAQLERFRDYHIGKGTKMADWDAAWRNWMRNSESYSGVRRMQAPTPQQQTFDQPGETVERTELPDGRVVEIRDGKTFVDGRDISHLDPDAIKRIITPVELDRFGNPVTDATPEYAKVGYTR